MEPLRRLRRELLPLLGLVASASAGPAGAAELAVREVGLARGDVVARVALIEPLDVATRNGVASGLPITVRYSVDLWRHRSHWFDQHVDARVESFRIRWDPRERSYTLEYPGPGRRLDAFETLDDLLDELAVRDLPVHPRGALGETSRYFAVVEVAIRPLTLDEFRELDGWIEGKLGGAEAPPDAPGGPGGEGLPGAVLDFLLGMAGFGDRILETRSDPFRPADLTALEPLSVAP